MGIYDNIFHELGLTTNANENSILKTTERLILKAVEYANTILQDIIAKIVKELEYASSTKGNPTSSQNLRSTSKVKTNQ